ncbi:hypothetical protein ABIE35_001589 [Paenarthrobacter sp. 4246]
MTNGFGPDDLVIQLYTGDVGTIIDGSSRCVPDPEGSKYPVPGRLMISGE